MKRIFYKLTIVFCLFASSALHAQASKIIHQSMTLDGAQTININVVGAKVEVKPSQGHRLMIETKIEIGVPSPRLLDFIVNQGRYNLVKEIDLATNELTVSSKKTNNILMVNGKECMETLSYIFYVPEAVKFANNSTIQDLSTE